MAHEVEIDGEPFLWKGLEKTRILDLFVLMDQVNGDPDNPSDVAIIRSAFARFGLDGADSDQIIQEWRRYKESKLSVFEEGLADVDM